MRIYLHSLGYGLLLVLAANAVFLWFVPPAFRDKVLVFSLATTLATVTLMTIVFNRWA